MKIPLLICLVAVETACAMTFARAATLTVTNTKDSDAGSLRQAIADAATGDTIVFEIPTSDRGYDPDTGAYTISLTSGELGIGKDLTITGPGSKVLNVLRSAAIGTPGFRIFDIGQNVTFTMSGLAVGNGNAGSGAGILAANGSVLTLKDVIVSNNEAVGGGGIYIRGDATITDSTISANISSGGGGIVHLGTKLVLTNSTVSGNQVRGPGTGGGIESNGTLMINNSTISGNLLLADNQGNNFNGIGAGIFRNGGTVVITNSTITANTISRPGAGGGGLYGGGYTLRNTIVALNTHSGAADDIDGNATSQGFNIIGVFSQGTLANKQPSDQLGVTAQQLNLGPLQDNGGPTFTHALLDKSVALENGNASGSSTDQRGFPRPVDTPKIANPTGGDGSDIGAFEVQADQLFGCNEIDQVVHNNDDSGPGSLRDVIANVCAGTTITFDDDVTEIDLTSDELVINKSLTIKGPGANVLSVQRSRDDGVPDFRIFHIGDNYQVAISGLTIANGNSVGNFSFGGGIFNSGSALTLTAVTISGNTAGLVGGGMASYGPTVITNSTISGNLAGSVGGLDCSAINISNSTISGNTSQHRTGALSAGLTSSIVSCTITNNSAADSAGGIFNSSAPISLMNSIVALNTAPSGADISGPVTSQGFNIIGDDDSATINNLQDSDHIGVSADDLQLGPLQDNGGPTFTHALLPNSVAIDQGDSSSAATDQRGVNRPVDHPTIPNPSGGDGGDIGAYEVQTLPPTPAPTSGLVGNVSTRLPVGTDDNVLIEGFIVQGPAGSTKKIIVRAIGPSLAPFGITDALANPILEIHDANNAIVASNDDWRVTQVGGLITAAQSAKISASGFAPGNDLESAIIADLAPGSYTAVVRGFGNSVGTGVVDAFDLSASSPARLANIATRGLIQPGDKLMIAGFIVQDAPVTAVVRAIGPSLAAFGITNALPDTTLQLRDQNGAIIVANDDWKVRSDGSSQQAELEATSLQPTNDFEAALVTDLQPGQYTAQVRGKPEVTGIGVVQVYFLQ